MCKNFTPYSKYAKQSLLSVFAVFFFSALSFSQNAIVTENALPGNPASEWDLATADAGDMSIQGFATDISVNRGNTINFKIDVNTGANKDFGIKIYRIGYYQGNGARLIVDLGNFTGVAQNACGYDGVTGLLDCGNWSTTASWTVPANAVSGLYIAKLTRVAAGGGGSSHIPFVVRNDASTSDLFFQTSDATWQAYNAYGGNSLYVGSGLPNNHASKVSYNRPFITRSGGGGGGAREDWFMNAEYPMIRFLERNGFDVSYTTNVDMARNGSLLLNHKVFMSTGHDEYWSKEQRDNVEAGRAAGKHLAFFSGNEVYWKTRWENSTDGNNTPYRTLVCYKEGTVPTPQENACGGKCDPATEWTGLWRDGCSFPSGNACKPENALTGQISWDGTTSTLTVPDTYKNLRFWRNTGVAGLGSGQTATLTNGTLGYEWDWEQYPASYPSGRITMSKTDFNGHTHKLSMYKHTSGAWVFGAGTVQWSWGLDDNHDRGTDPVDASMQQATINLFADMGVQPATLQSGLQTATASTDTQAPNSYISLPGNGAIVSLGDVVTVSGTAADLGGGVVAGVEISTDAGATWQVADGTANWSFSWVPPATGNYLIKTRAFDDSGNMEVAGGNEGSPNTITITVIPASNPTYTIFTPSQSPDPSDRDQNDGTPISLGVKFRANTAGTISAIRFYKATSDNQLCSVQLYTLGGSLLASATQTGTPTPGWTEVAFSSPISISANTTYVAAFHSPSGGYTGTDNGFATAIVNGPLTGIANSDPNGPNGVYLYTNSPALPTQTYNATNYWVDVKFNPTTGPDNIPPTVVTASPADGATGINITSFVSAIFSEDIIPATITSTNFEVKDASNTVVAGTLNYNTVSRSATFIPNSELSYSTVYTATVKGGISGIKDLAGNAMTADFVWSFETTPAPPIPPNEGGGGPVLVISDVNAPFSRYPVEILQAQGYNAYTAMDISEVRATPTVINYYDVIILGQVAVNGTDVTEFTNWTNAGGTLIAFRPVAGLLPLMGLTSTGSTLSDRYLLVNNTAGQPGAGIVNQTIQYHGTADLYTMQSGTTSLATLYSNASTATANPAITIRNVGSNGGRAVAFSYDLARSVVYTRQGNPQWAGQSRDGQTGPIRSDNLFFPDWIDFNKVAIPQADEQQHLLTNIILQSNLHRKPLPHLWILPRGLKAAVIMTGDDHGHAATVGRFNQYMTLGPNTPQDVADWRAIRGTSYITNGTPISDADVSTFQSNGFEIALHPNTGCANFTPSSLNNVFTTQLASLASQLPSLTAPVTNRTHCMPWSTWSSHASVENAHGIRFDVNYYYWPGSWIQNRPGMFTGSGMPMRFSNMTGSIIDCYQGPTVITDESGQTISTHINSLLDKALGAEGYYGAFVMNMHTDTADHTGSNTIISAALSRNVPVISAKQMLEWLDTRNGTVFGPMTWSNNELSFSITTSAHNLQAMVPVKAATGTLIQVTENGTPIAYTVQTIKGIDYGFFNASTNNYVAIYSVGLPVTLTDLKAVAKKSDIELTWKTQSEQNNKGFEIQRSTDAANWSAIGFVNGAGESNVTLDYKYTDKNLAAGIYYYRLRQVDFDNKFTYSPVVSAEIKASATLTLYQNTPNPFNKSTTIRFDLPKQGKIKLAVYDVHGREVKVLVNDVKQAGTHIVNFDANTLSSGIYYYRLITENGNAVRKMIIE